MTNFVYKNFEKSGEYVSYNGKFVARFKYNRRRKVPFLRFIAKNVSVEDYFAELDAGKSPAEIAESRGYKCPVVAKQIREAVEGTYNPSQVEKLLEMHTEQESTGGYKGTFTADGSDVFLSLETKTSFTVTEEGGLQMSSGLFYLLGQYKAL